MERYSDNQWGFDVETTPPFLAFRVLREKAVEHFGEANVLDLSQGEPGYGFAPNVRSRLFYSFLLLLDVEFNNNDSGEHFAEYTPDRLPEILDRVKEVAHTNYTLEKAEELLRDFEFFLEELVQISDEQKLGYGKFEILYDIFKYSVPAGGRYPNPWGEPIVRAAMAHECRRVLKADVQRDDVMLISGAAHGIGTIFNALGEEGIGFLKRGDLVMVTSPVYAPYNGILEDRGIRVTALPIDPLTGKVSEKGMEELKACAEPIKAMILINPNNPTGFPYGRKLLEELSEVAEQHNALIISDEVYLQFFEKAESILEVPKARKRTIQISSMSKTERATGVRFGAFVVLPEAREYISQSILQDYLGKYKEIFWLLFLAKSPGGKTIGAFQHITGIPGPSQILGLCHLILGEEERKKYLKDVRKKVEIFYEHLGLPVRENSYYGIFDIAALENEEKKNIPVEQKLIDIAERGVVLMPANLFFSEQDRREKNCKTYVRVSLPNLSFENTKKAAEIIREYLRE